MIDFTFLKHKDLTISNAVVTFSFETFGRETFALCDF
jgi:hypothetical protein